MSKKSEANNREPELPMDNQPEQRAAPRPSVEQMPEKDIFEQYGEEINPRNIVGQLLRFNKGDWVTGQDSEELPQGKRMIVNMDQLLLGWLRWEEQKPADMRMGLLVEGFKPPSRHSLGYGYNRDQPEDQSPDTTEWELDNTGQPRDPWQFTYYLVMRDPDMEDEGEGIYTFTTSSTGGKSAIGDLCKLYGRKRREGYKDHYPVVALKVGKYKHSTSQFGWIKVPVLPVVGWASKNVFGELPPPTDATLQLSHTKDEDIPF
jgi:hypothetical protein